MAVDMELLEQDRIVHQHCFTFLLRIYINSCPNCLCCNVNILQGPVQLVYLLHHWGPLADLDGVNPRGLLSNAIWQIGVTITQPLVILGMFMLWWIRARPLYT